jgi:hypothetical protein
MNTITHRVAAVVATGLLSVGMHAQKQPKNHEGAKRFGRQTEFINCATVPYNAGQNQQKFEQWLAPKVEAVKAHGVQKSGQGVTEVVTIPVVVHIIHNGDAIGTNENIADEQVFSQITVLNEDFRRMFGTPGYNTNPVGADMEIEFCLAQRDPNGLLSTGITRHNFGQATWEMSEVEELKAQTQWDPTKYLNIWVVSEVTLQNIYLLAGYAQFPVQSGLEGLEGQTNTANTDGVVIGARYFGSEDIYPQGFYEDGNKGRSATHEIGHFFGLRHIWGDEDNCSATDYCNDTPVHYSANAGCPEAGFDSCPSQPGNDMVANYMDYTNDACKNVFTADQKARMLAVLANSPRRASLITSNGCEPGLVYDNDGTLNLQINSVCGGDFEPVIVLKNTGNNTITTAVFTYQVDGQPQQTYTWSGSLANGEEDSITITGLSAAPGNHEFTTAMLTVNGVPDEVPGNDTLSTPFTIASMYNTEMVIVTVNTDDYGYETIWAITDSNGDFVYANVDLEDPWGSDFYDDNETYVTEVPLEPNQCYTFTIVDLAGDGMCCDFGEGSYSIATSNGTVIAAGGEFTDQEETEFGIQGALSSGGFTAQNGVTLYPNPANSTLYISAGPNTTLPEGYTVYNSLGQVVGNGKIEGNNQPVNISSYANGVYFIKLQSGATTQTLEFVKY